MSHWCTIYIATWWTMNATLKDSRNGLSGIQMIIPYFIIIENIYSQLSRGQCTNPATITQIKCISITNAPLPAHCLHITCGSLPPSHTSSCHEGAATAITPACSLRTRPRPAAVARPRPGTWSVASPVWPVT